MIVVRAWFSPPAWGWSADLLCALALSSVFPTRVGMVRSFGCSGPGWSRFPHPRGDGPSSEPTSQLHVGFSPPAWGWSVAHHGPRHARAVFPTRVGMVRGRNGASLPGCSFPHPRGDGPRYLARARRHETAFSPPAWGWSGELPDGDWLAGVFPTRVGMVREPRRALTTRGCFPHPRGDGPREVESSSATATFSPPAWGWSGSNRWRYSSVVVFPTRVGMVRNPRGSNA